MWLFTFSYHVILRRSHWFSPKAALRGHPREGDSGGGRIVCVVTGDFTKLGEEVGARTTT